MIKNTQCSNPMQNQIEMDYYQKNDLILPIQHDIQEIIYDPNDQILSQYCDYIKDSDVDFKLGLLQSGLQKLGWVLQNIQAQKSKANLNSIFIQAVTLLNNQALKYLNHGEVQNSMLILEKCLTWTNHTDADPLMRIITLSNIGVCYRKKGKLSKSLDMFNEALQIMFEHNVKSYLSNVYLNLAIIQSQIGAHVKSIEFARKALAESQFELIDIIKPVQNNQLKNKNENSKSNEQLIDADQIDGQPSQNESKIINLILCYKTLAQEEEHFQNFEEALHNYEKAVDVAQQNLGSQNQLTLSCIKEFSQFSQRYSKLQVFQIQKQQQNKQKFPSSPFKVRNLAAYSSQNLARPKVSSNNLKLEKKLHLSPNNKSNIFSIKINNVTKSSLLDNQMSTKNSSNFFKNSSQISFITSPSSKMQTQSSNFSAKPSPSSVSFYKKTGSTQRPQQSFIRRSSKSICQTQASASSDKSEQVLDYLGFSQIISKKNENKEYDSLITSPSMRSQREQDHTIVSQSSRARQLSLGNRPSSTKNSIETNRSKILFTQTTRNSPSNRSQAQSIFKTINSPYFTNLQEIKSPSSKLQINPKLYKLQSMSRKNNYLQNHQLDTHDNIVDTLKVQFQQAFLNMKKIEQQLKCQILMKNNPLNKNMKIKQTVNIPQNANKDQNSFLNKRNLRPQSMHFGSSRSVNVTPYRNNQKIDNNFEDFQEVPLNIQEDTNSSHFSYSLHSSNYDIKLLLELNNTFLKDFSQQNNHNQGDLKFYLNQNTMIIQVLFQMNLSQYHHTIDVSDKQFQKIEPMQLQNLLVSICNQISENLYIDLNKNYLVYFNQIQQLSENQSQVLINYKDKSINLIQKSPFNSILFFQKKSNSNKYQNQQQDVSAKNLQKSGNNTQNQANQINTPSQQRTVQSQQKTNGDDIGEEIYVDDFDLDNSFDSLSKQIVPKQQKTEKQNQKDNFLSQKKIQVQLQDKINSPQNISQNLSPKQQQMASATVTKNDTFNNQSQEKYFKNNIEIQPASKIIQINTNQQQLKQNNTPNDGQKQNQQTQEKRESKQQQKKIQLDIKSIYEKVNHVKRIEIQQPSDNSNNVNTNSNFSPKNTSNKFSSILSEQLNAMSEVILNKNTVEEGQNLRKSQRIHRSTSSYSKKGTLESQFFKTNIPGVPNQELSPINKSKGTKGQAFNENQQIKHNQRNSPKYLTRQEQIAGLKIWRAYEQMKYKKVIDWANQKQKKMGRFLIYVFYKKFFQKLVQNLIIHKKAAVTIQNFYRQKIKYGLKNSNMSLDNNAKKIQILTIFNFDSKSITNKNLKIDQDRVIKIQQQFKAYLLRKSIGYQNQNKIKINQIINSNNNSNQNKDENDKQSKNNSDQTNSTEIIKKQGSFANLFKDLSVIVKIQRLFRKKQVKKQKELNQKNEIKDKKVDQKVNQKIDFFKDLSIIIKIQRLFRKRQARKQKELILKNKNKEQKINEQNQQVQKVGQNFNFFNDLAIIIKIQRLFRKRQARKQRELILKNENKDNNNQDSKTVPLFRKRYARKLLENNKNKQIQADRNQIDSANLINKIGQKINFFNDLAIIIKLQRLFRQRQARKNKELTLKNENKQQKVNLQDQKVDQKYNFFNDLAIIIKIQRLFRQRKAREQKKLALLNKNKEQTNSQQNQQVQKVGQKFNFFNDLAVIIKIQRLFRKRQAKKQLERNRNKQNQQKLQADIDKNNLNQINSTQQSNKISQKINFFNDLAIIIKIQRLFRKRQARKNRELLLKNEKKEQKINKNNKEILKDGQKSNFFNDLAVIIKIQRFFRKRQAQKQQEENKQKLNKEQQLADINKNSRNQINSTGQINKIGQKTNFFNDLAIIIKIQRFFRKRQARKIKESNLNNENKQQILPLNSKNQLCSPDIEKKDHQLINFFNNLGIIIKIQRIFRKKLALKQKNIIQNNQNIEKNLSQKSNDHTNNNNSLDSFKKEGQLTNFLKNLGEFNQQTQVENHQQTQLCQAESNQVISNKQVNLRSSDNQKQYTLFVRAPENEPTEIDKQQQNQISLQNIQEQFYDFQTEETNKNKSIKYKQRSLNKNLTVPTQMKMLNEVYQNLPQQNEYESNLSDDKLTYSQHLIFNIQNNISSLLKQDTNNDKMDQIVSKLVTSIDIYQDKGVPNIENQNDNEQEVQQNLQFEKEKFINQNSDQNYSIQKNFNLNKKNLNNSEQRNNLPSKFQDQLQHNQFDPEKKSNKHLQDETLQQNQVSQKDLTLTAQFSNNSQSMNQNLKQQLQFNFSQQKQSDQSQQSNSLAPLSPNFPNKSQSEKIINSSQQNNMLFPKHEENVFKFLNDRIPPEQGQQSFSKDTKAKEQLIQRKINNSSTLPPRDADRYLKFSNDRMPSIKELEMVQSKEKYKQINHQNLPCQITLSNINDGVIVQQLNPTNQFEQVNEEDQGQGFKSNQMQKIQNNFQETTEIKEESNSIQSKQENKINGQQITQEDQKEQNGFKKQNKRNSQGMNLDYKSSENQTPQYSNKIISQLELLNMNKQQNDQN
ncbi:hypothetical protein ABPG74_022664 [Tetrahymena malaccensis]